MNDFFNVVNDITPLQKEEQMALAKAVRIRHLDLGDAWIKEGMSTHQLAFVSEGYIRKYYLRNGREVTDGFFFDNAFAGDLPGLLARRPALCHLVAMEPTELFLLSFDSLEAMAQKYRAIERFLRSVVTQDFVQFYHRHLGLHVTPAHERYAQLLHQQPLVTQRAEPYHIASYLGITLQQLSRARGAIKKPG
ncbi:MAG TPA: Crp/Fnr family transcriptional regulator [Dinghuibacter sp.]|uniref:Crp/Fnr family transcriptional regulator n=1 Tax=Dinghuibacter sp. TaxID=2024697 RepID=UPI002BFB1245|nr:Crp/Fnr family transcriptional regulator [Dinghuibacter sp.]HTJ14876.1 Crp/Fnr family transcriptional regulator [Dinghuibacter sp.]